MTNVRATGFKLTDSKGHGFIRNFDDSEEVSTNLPMPIKQVYIAQHAFPEFKDAYCYCNQAAGKYRFSFESITKEEKPKRSIFNKLKSILKTKKI